MFTCIVFMLISIKVRVLHVPRLPLCQIAHKVMLLYIYVYHTKALPYGDIHVKRFWTLPKWSKALERLYHLPWWAKTVGSNPHWDLFHAWIFSIIFMFLKRRGGDKNSLSEVVRSPL